LHSSLTFNESSWMGFFLANDSHGTKKDDFHSDQLIGGFRVKNYQEFSFMFDVFICQLLKNNQLSNELHLQVYLSNPR